MFCARAHTVEKTFFANQKKNMKTIEACTIPGFATVKLKDEGNDVPCLILKSASNSEASEDDWDQLQTIIDTFASRQVQCRMFIDISKATMSLTMSYIQRWSKFFHHNRHYLRECVRFVAFITENMLYQNLIRVGIALYNPIVPFHVVDTKERLL